MATYINEGFKNADMQAWEAYKKNPTPENKSALLKRFNGVIQAQVNKWSGVIPNDVLYNEAVLLAMKGFDTYDPKSGAALATHLTNSLLPLSRTVYTYQNTARLPENIAIKMNAYNAAISHLTAVNGYSPSTEELHKELGWSKPELERIQSYDRKNLVESGSAVSGGFFDTQSNEDADEQVLGGVYMSLDPDEQKLFRYTTGYGNAPVKSNPEIMREMGLTQSQLSYKKTQLTNHIKKIMERPSLRRMYGE